MKREQDGTVLLVIAAWVMGALMGSQVQFHAKTSPHPSGVVRFPPGVYQIEPAEPGNGDVYWVDYDVEWQARLLAR